MQVYDLEGNGNPEIGLSFDDKSVRRGFIKKVYSIIAMQLIFTFGTIALFLYETNTRNFLMENQSAFWGIFITCMISTFVILIFMSCSRTLRVSFPSNFILLGLFTAAESVMVGQCCMFYPHHIVLISAGVTAAIVIGLTIFAFQTKIDFTLCGSLLFACLMTFFIFGLLIMVLPSFGVDVKILHLVYSAIGVFIFSLYLIFDTQVMMGGDHSTEVSPEEYIFAALAIYLDIINIFLHILRLMAHCSE